MIELSHDENGDPTGGTCVKSIEAEYGNDKVNVTTVVCSYGDESDPYDGGGGGDDSGGYDDGGYDGGGYDGGN